MKKLGWKRGNWLGIKRGHCPLILGILFLLLASCSFNDTPPVMMDDTPEQIDGSPTVAKNKECPQLDSRLYQLFLMADPISTAEDMGLRVKDGKVQVLLVLVAEDTAIPEGFDLMVGTRSGNQVQVLVPFHQLCDLANTDAVIAIRQPASPVLE